MGTNIVSELLWYVQRLDLIDGLDMLLVAIAFFSIIYLVRGTRAVPLLRGVVILAIVLVPLTGLIRLRAFGWLTQRALPALLVAIPVIFQQELRRALERLGRAGSLLERTAKGRAILEQTLDAIRQACQVLSQKQHGALVVLERETGLQEFADTGASVHADTTSDMLVTIFDPHTVLHDGAVIIRQGQILAAACVLPLSDISLSDRELGLRHRAAIGVTEESDAIAVVVSEERGAVSLAHNGGLIRNLDAKRLERMLKSFYQPVWERTWPRWRVWLRRRLRELEPKTVLRWISSSASLMLLASLLAALVWLVAVEEHDPTIEEWYAQTVPVTLTELPRGMVTVDEVDERVQVSLRAPQSVWRSLGADDFEATAHLAGLAAGSHSVPIQIKLGREPSRVVSIQPEVVELALEPKAERVARVRVQVEGRPALGYLTQRPIVEPREVTVAGPSSYVTKVVEAVARVSVRNADSDVEEELRLQPQDADGQLVPYVTLMPEVADVRVPVELSGYYRPMAVKAVLEGQVEPGYHIVDISIEPPTVTVFGTPDAMAELPGYVETESIDLEGAQDDIVVRPALNAPPYITVVTGREPLKVEIEIEAIKSSQTMEIAPELQGLSPGLTVTTSLDPVEVILGGPLVLLEGLDTSDVRVVLDLFNVPAGSHQIEPLAIVPEGLTAQSISPPLLQIEISTAPNPTPGAE